MSYLEGIFIVRMWIESHFISMILDHGLKVQALMLYRQELLMHDLESITDCIILPFEGPKAGENRVVNTLDKNDLFKRIVILDGVVLLGPSGNSLLASRNICCWISAYVSGSSLASIWSGTVHERVSDVLHHSLLSLWLTRIPQNTVLIHQIRKELWAETNCVFLHILIVGGCLVSFEENRESGVPVESFGAEIGEGMAVGYVERLFLDSLEIFRVAVLHSSHSKALLVAEELVAHVICVSVTALSISEAATSAART